MADTDTKIRQLEAQKRLLAQQVVALFTLLKGTRRRHGGTYFNPTIPCTPQNCTFVEAPHTILVGKLGTGLQPMQSGLDFVGE